MKRLLCVLGASLAVITKAPMNAFPADTVRTANVNGASFTYVLNGNTATLTGVETAAAELVIPEKIDGFLITAIDDRAFFGNSDIVSVTVPDSVESIGDSAFAGCLSLEAIDIPDSVRELGASCFISCSALKTAAIGECVTEIPERCFYSCTSLSSVEIPLSVKKIGAEAFFSCTDLHSLAVPYVVSEIGENAIGMQYNIRSGVEKTPDFTVICEWDTAAQDYAEAHGLNYEITVQYTLGDVNLDGLIDSADASLILVESALAADSKPSILNEKQMLAADYNKDGLIDPTDSSLILVYSASIAGE